MSTNTNVNNLVINKLTKAQYDAIQNPSETELYLVEEEIDTTPTSGSNNPITSGAVYIALQGKASTNDLASKEDKMIIEAVASPGATLTAEIGKYYTMSNVGTMTITLPAGSGTKTQTIVFYISTASTTNVDFTSTSTVYKSKGFTIDADSTYEINALWNGVAWVIGQMEIEIPSS